MKYTDITTIAREAFAASVRDEKSISPEIKEFVEKHIFALSPTSLFNEKELAWHANHIFGNVEIRGFVLEYTYQFFTRFGLLVQDPGVRPNYETLVNSIQEASSYAPSKLHTNDHDSKLLIPKVLTSRQFDNEEIRVILYNNKWLVALLALKMCP